MEQILLAYILPKDSVIAVIMLYKNTKAMACTPSGVTDFDIFPQVLQGNTYVLYLFIIYLDYILRMLIDQLKVLH